MLKIYAWKAFGKYTKNGAKINPKRETWNVQRRTFYETFLRVIFDMFLKSFLDRTWVQNGSKKGSKMRRKITQNGLPRQGDILELFWVDFWVILDQFGGHFWIDFGLISIGSLGPILVQLKQQDMERNRQKLHEIIGHSEKWKEIAGNGGT